MSHNHSINVDEMVATWAHVELNMLESCPWICSVGLEVMMSLSMLHSLVVRVGCVALDSLLIFTSSGFGIGNGLCLFSYNWVLLVVMVGVYGLCLYLW